MDDQNQDQTQSPKSILEEMYAPTDDQSSNQSGADQGLTDTIPAPPQPPLPDLGTAPAPDVTVVSPPITPETDNAPTGSNLNLNTAQPVAEAVPSAETLPETGPPAGRPETVSINLPDTGPALPINETPVPPPAFADVPDLEPNLSEAGILPAGGDLPTGTNLSDLGTSTEMGDASGLLGSDSTSPVTEASSPAGEAVPAPEPLPPIPEVPSPGEVAESVSTPVGSGGYSFPQYQPPPAETSTPVGVAAGSAFAAADGSQIMAPGKPKKSKILMLLPILALILIVFGALFVYRNFRGKSKPSGPITLTYWGLFEPKEVFQQVIADYRKDNPDVTINYVQQANTREYRERLVTALSKGGGPDIFRIHLSWLPMLGAELSPIPASTYSLAEYEKTFYPSASENLKYKNSYVGVPIYFDSLVLFYNEDLFRAAGQNPPSTWEDLIKTACTLTVRDQTGRIKTGGIALGTTNNVDHWSDILGLMLLQNKANPAKPDLCDDRLVCAGADAISFYTGFAKNSVCRSKEGSFLGAVWSDLMPTSTYAFATGSVAMYVAPSWRVFDIMQLNSSLNFKTIPVPQLSNEENDKVAWATYWVEAVSNQSVNSAEAWKFVKYLSTKEVLEKLYQAEINLGPPRIFGEPYSRVDMADMVKTAPYVGAVIEQAPYAHSWYLSSFTGDNGINDNIIEYYQDAVNKVAADQEVKEALKTAAQGVSQVLTQFGITPAK